MPWRVLDSGPFDLTVDMYRVILEGAPAMLWLGDASGQCVYLNRMQREFWGLRTEDVPGFSWASTLHPDDVDEVAHVFKVAMADQKAFDLEARYRRADGSFRILHTEANPRLGPAGELLGMVGVNADVTAERELERRTALLTDELAHRNKNLFSVVGSIVSITERETTDRGEAFERLRSRLRALAHAHEETKDAGGAGASRSLHGLVDLILQPYRNSRGKITVSGPDLNLSQRASASLALILQELATNSAKYGSLSGGGVLHFTTEEAGSGNILITWRDRAISQATAEQHSEGFGSQLLSMIATDLEARITTGLSDGEFVFGIDVGRDALTSGPQ